MDFDFERFSSNILVTILHKGLVHAASEHPVLCFEGLGSFLAKADRDFSTPCALKDTFVQPLLFTLFELGSASSPGLREGGGSCLA